MERRCFSALVKDLALSYSGDAPSIYLTKIDNQSNKILLLRSFNKTFKIIALVKGKGNKGLSWKYSKPCRIKL